MELNQTTGYVVYRAWDRGLATPRYIYFWDGYDMMKDFDNEADLIKELEDEYGGDNWKDSIEIHQIQVTETRIK